MLDAHCVRRRGFDEVCVFSGEGLDGVRPVSWAERDSKMYVVENLRALVALDFSASDSLGRFSGRAPLSRDAATTAVAVGTTLSQNAAAEAERLERGYPQSEIGQWHGRGVPCRIWSKPENDTC